MVVSRWVNKSKQVLSGLMVEQHRVWIISRMNSAKDQEIYPLSEPDLDRRSWSARGFSPDEVEQIERMPVSAVIEFQAGRTSVMRVR